MTHFISSTCVLLIIFTYVVYRVISRSCRKAKRNPQSIRHQKKQNASKSKKNKKSRHHTKKRRKKPPKPYRMRSLNKIAQIESDTVPVPPLTLSKSTPDPLPNLRNHKTRPRACSHFNFDSFRNISNEYTLDCSFTSCIKKCLAIHRIIYALKYYESLDIISDNNTSHISTFIDNIDSIYTTKRLLDDFIHIQSKHSRNIERLSSFMLSKLSNRKCNMNKCISLARHHRDRNLDRNHSDLQQDEKWIFIRDLFDNIHSYVFHTFDVGLRIQRKQLENIKHTHHDKYFKNIVHILKKNHRKLKTFGRFKGNKYLIGNRKGEPQELGSAYHGTTWTDGLFEYISEQGIGYKEQKKLQTWIMEEEYDSESIANDVNDIKKIHDSNIIRCLNHDKKKLAIVKAYSTDGTLYESSFSTGFIFYYWPYYRKRRTKSLYIKAKYGSIRDEVLNNVICRISLHLFEDTVKKAQQFMITKRVKCMSSSNDYLHCGMKQHSPFTMDHLLALILYCDCTDLCSAFSSTFRRKQSFEPLSCIKQRNREYWNLSKLLRECVALFGEHKGYYDHDRTQWTGVVGPFYCGMSFCCVLPQFNIQLNGPTSTSKHIEVATRFGGDHGVIIELNNNSDCDSAYLKCFDCSWISNFNAESERLFFGDSKHRMRVQSIQNIETQSNFQFYFHALFYFDCMLNGTEMERNTKDKITKMDVEIITKLIKHQLKGINNGFPTYINDTFESFCCQKREIVLNLHYICTYFVDLRHLVLRYRSCLLSEIVFRLFKNLESVEMETTERLPYKEYSFSLSELSQCVLDSEYNVNNVRLIMNADWKMSRYTYHVMQRSWIGVELATRRPLDWQKYVIEMTTHKVQNRFCRDCLVVFKR